jgi:hypothetical protein
VHQLVNKILCCVSNFVVWSNSPPGALAISLLGLRTQAELHTQRHTTVGRTPLNQRSARRSGHYLQSTQQTQGTIIHDPGGIRTRNPYKRAAADPCLNPRVHPLYSPQMTHLLFVQTVLAEQLCSTLEILLSGSAFFSLNLDWDIEYVDWSHSWISSVHPGKFIYNTTNSNEAMALLSFPVRVTQPPGDSTRFNPNYWRRR